MDLTMAADIASRGFYDDPVMNWVFPEPATRLESLQVSFGMFARRFLARAGRVDVLDEACVAMWLPPDPPPPPEAEELPPKETWHLFTPEVTARFEALGAVMDAAHPADPHWYLAAVATVPEEQGRGLGARILRPVMDICDADGVPAYLESSNARNLPFYYRHGFVQTGEILVPEGPVLFPMWREPHGS